MRGRSDDEVGLPAKKRGRLQHIDDGGDLDAQDQQTLGSLDRGERDWGEADREWLMRQKGRKAAQDDDAPAGAAGPP